MMHLKEYPSFFKRIFLFFKPHLPSHNDNFMQATLKTAFILFLSASIIFTSFFLNFFMHSKSQQKIITETQEIWNTADIKKDDSVYTTLKKLNPDFKAWLKVGTGIISYPVFQTDDNSYYKSHNLKRRNSRYGALYFDKFNNLDKLKSNFNLLIYGNSMPDGSMFTRLEEYRQIDFLKQHNTIVLSFPKENATYKVFSAFIYGKNESFNIFTQHIENENEFNVWSEKIKTLSFINTDIDLKFGDTFLTLISESRDFAGAKNVVIARKTRTFETSYTDTSKFTVNRNRKLPIK